MPSETIDLRRIPTYVLNCASQPERAAHVRAQLAKVDIEPRFFPAIECKPSRLGCGLTHLKVVTQIRDPYPFLVLEDDITIAPGFKPILEVPEEALVAYLGVSIWGMLPEVHSAALAFAAIATRYNPDWLRVHNMLSGHAILYLSDAFRAGAKEAIVQQLTRDEPYDIGYALLQRDHLALTPNEPLFYQDLSVGGRYEATRHALLPVADPASVRARRVDDRWQIMRPRLIAAPPPEPPEGDDDA